MRGCTRGAVSLAMGRNLLQSPRGGLTLTRQFPPELHHFPNRFLFAGLPANSAFYELPSEARLAPLEPDVFCIYYYYYYAEASVPLTDKCTILPRKFLFFFKRKKKKKKQRVIDVIPRKRNPRPFQLRALQVKGKKKKSFKNLLPF